MLTNHVIGKQINRRAHDAFTYILAVSASACVSLNPQRCHHDISGPNSTPNVKNIWGGLVDLQCLDRLAVFF